jgi:predicted ATPase
LLARERLVTVVGPGGCGKTRLAIEVLSGRPLHGFVELAAAAGATDLARAALNACGLPEEPGRAPLDQLVELGDGLLVLDNCVHLRREVAALVDALLGRCPPYRGASCAASRPYWSSGAGGRSCSTARSARTSWT